MLPLLGWSASAHPLQPSELPDRTSVNDGLHNVTALEWLALLLSCAASTLFAVKALMPTLMQHIPQQTIVVLGVLMGANVGLMLAVKFGCYA